MGWMDSHMTFKALEHDEPEFEACVHLSIIKLPWVLVFLPNSDSYFVGLLISLEMTIAHGGSSLNNPLRCYIFWTPQTINQGPHTAFTELLLQVEVETRGVKRASTDPREEESPGRNSGPLTSRLTDFILPTLPETGARMGVSLVTLPRVCLVILACLLRRLWQKNKWFLWRSDSNRVIREPSGQCLGTYSGTAHQRATESWRLQLLGHPASHRWRGGDRLLTWGTTHSQLSLPPLPGTGKITSARVSAVYLGATYPASGQPHLTTRGSRAGQMLEERAGWASLDRITDMHLSFFPWASPLSGTHVPQPELK